MQRCTTAASNAKITHTLCLTDDAFNGDHVTLLSFAEKEITEEWNETLYDYDPTEMPESDQNLRLYY